MKQDPLATFVALFERVAPEIRARMKPAVPERIAALEALTPPLPPEYRRFLELAGGSPLGSLSPFLPLDRFDVEHAIAATIARAEAAAREPSEDPDEPSPHFAPAGWVFLCQRFDRGDPSYCWHLASQTSRTPPDPLGRARVAWGLVDGEGNRRDIAHHASLEEFLIYSLLALWHPESKRGELRFYRNEDDECEAGEYFVDTVEEAGFRLLAGGEHDWYQLFEDEHGTWLWLDRNPAYLEDFGRYVVFVRAASPERLNEVCSFIHRELDCS